MGPLVGGDRAPPTICAAALSQHPSLSPGDDQTVHHKLLERTVDISDADRLPATWAMPKHDFDEALGLLAIGNTFGELAICDYVNQPLEHLSGLSDDCVEKFAEDIVIASKVRASQVARSLPDYLEIWNIQPVIMSIPSIGYLLRRDDVADQVADTELSGGSARLAAGDMPHEWTNKWTYFGNLDKWQGFPNDKAWWIEHCWNFIGRPELLLYARHNEGSTIFRAGGLYFILGEDDLYVFDASVTFPDVLDALRNDRMVDILLDQPLAINQGAQSQGGQFYSFFHWEINELERNRRNEQIERGGSPHSSIFGRKRSAWIYANPDYQKYAREECHPSDEESEETDGEDESGQDDQSSDDEGSYGSQERDED